MTGHNGDHLKLWLSALRGPSPADHFYEVRHRRDGGMGQTFIPAGELDRAAALIRNFGNRTDVFVGVGMRSRRQGGADAVPAMHTAWVDLDTAEAVRRLDSHPVPPSIVVASGHGSHAYWILDNLYPPEKVSRANRRLAFHLGGDLNCCDPARIMRPPGTLNFKDRDNPKPVEAVRVHVETYALSTLAGQLPDPPVKRPEPRTAPTGTPADDPLLRIAPAEYVEIFTGQEVGRDGKVRCPFHPDRTPSLHVYPGPDQGWACFGCGKGGTIYDFAGHLWGVDTRGESFKELRRRIIEELRQVIA